MVYPCKHPTGYKRTMAAFDRWREKTLEEKMMK
jgi:hypothetical protein